MLNLLISIVTEAQTKFTNDRIIFTYREKTMQVREKSFSFLYNMFVNDEKKTHNALYIIEQSKPEVAEERNVNDHIEELSKRIGQVVQSGGLGDRPSFNGTATNLNFNAKAKRHSDAITSV